MGGGNGTILERHLKGYKETLVIDDYPPYHTLMKKDGELKVTGCLANAHRKFAEFIKATRKAQSLTAPQEVASEAIRLIYIFYHLP